MMQNILKISSFTFHHVSIKTCNLVTQTAAFALFTFHHVSIKTKAIIMQI